MNSLFRDSDHPLDGRGYKAQKGQIVDASFVNVPRQRNTREENEQIKSGDIPQRFIDNPQVGRQKDTDTRWAKKTDETHFGYKNHVTVDNKHKLIRNYGVTSAEVHDWNEFISIFADKTSKDVRADSAYRSQNHEVALATMGYRSQVHRKGYRNKPLNKKGNKRTRKSRKCAPA